MRRADPGKGFVADLPARRGVLRCGGPNHYFRLCLPRHNPNPLVAHKVYQPLLDLLRGRRADRRNVKEAQAGDENREQCNPQHNAAHRSCQIGKAHSAVLALRVDGELLFGALEALSLQLT